MYLKKGEMIGAWRVARQIGKGGNGVVYKATQGGRIAAVKVIHARDRKRITRFADEIKAMQRCSDLPGVLPLYESFFPTEHDNQPPWIAMPLAVGLVKALGHAKTFDRIVDAIRGIATALASIHEREISHRDVKPDNLFHFNGNWVVGDFGLADFDGKQSETAPMEKVGPIHYIAPEMLNSASASDGKAVDVYSLAKTMWVLGSGQRYPLPGHQLASTPAMTISAFTDHPRAILLDRLIENATNFDPTRRPTMREFIRELEAWIVTSRPSPDPTQYDLGAYRRLLEGRLRRIQDIEEADSRARKFKNEHALRLTARFRDIALELREDLTKAGFLFLSQSGVFYGFQLSATVPFEPGEIERHGLEVLLETGPSNSDGSKFILEARFRHKYQGSHPNGESHTKFALLWQSKREFFSGGSDEEQQILAMIQDLRGELVPAIETVLSAAGVI